MRLSGRFAIAVLAALLLPVHAAHAHARRTLRAEIPGQSLRSAKIGVPVAGLRVEGSAESSVRLIVAVHCEDPDDRCEERLDRVRIESNRSRDRVELGLKGVDLRELDDIRIEATLLIPRGLALEIDMGAGELAVRHLEGDLDVELGAGEVDIRVPERAVRSVDLSVGVGELSLTRGGRREEYVRILSGPVRWTEGPGRARIGVSLGAGEVGVELF